MYSDMSKRNSSTPMMLASWRQTSVLPTPVGPENRNEPIGLPSVFKPARESLMAEARVSMASFWPNTTSFSLVSKSRSASLSDVVTWFEGMRAIFATTCSTSTGPMDFLRRLGVTSSCAAPASSITSMALSGMKRSVM